VRHEELSDSLGNFIRDHQRRSGIWEVHYRDEFGVLRLFGDGLLVFKAAVSRQDPLRFEVIFAAPQLSFREGDITDLGALQERLVDTLI
jgi:hypothetical protein